VSNQTTSVAAAGKLTRTAQDEAALLAWMQTRGEYGATDEEIRNHFGWTCDYERPRRWQLSHKRGDLRDSGGTRPNAEGNAMTVWVYTGM
jgi:hypothetical protein